MMAKILVVDDAAFMRLRAVKLLTEAGYTVIEAENGRLAVEAYTRERPDCRPHGHHHARDGRDSKR